MEQKTDRLYPSGALENNDFEQRLKKNLNDINSFYNHIKNIKEMITYFKELLTKKDIKNNKTLNTKLESVHSIVFIRATSISICLSVTGIGLIILLTSAGIACTLSLRNKVLHKIDMNKYEK